jgi:glyoxylase-like metal-dependent hydrolase (beta-lactamase superfamily II)
MIFRHFLLGVNEANAFVAACEETRDAVLVDVGDIDPRIVDFLEENRLRLTTIFITHDHYDHTGGLSEAVAQYDATVLSAKGAVGGRKARRVGHGEEIRVGRLVGKVLATPGHTPDSISLALPGMVFTGDALFSGSIGGITSPRDAQIEIDHIRRNIFTLPDDYEIHPGHGPSSVVGVEKRCNPFFV